MPFDQFLATTLSSKSYCISQGYITAFLTLGLLYISGIAMLLCLGPNPWEWLLIDGTAIALLSIQHRAGPRFRQRVAPRRRWLHLGLILITTSICIGIAMYAAEPSYSFFAGAQTFLEACFADSRRAIVVFFSILRLLLIAYIGAQLIFAVFQISRGESPLPLLLPALAVVIAITIGSVVTELVLNGTTCT